MTWARIIYPLQQAGRCLVLVVALSALVLAGAFAAERALEPPVPASVVAGDTGHDNLGITPGSEEPADGMVPGGRPCTEPSAYIQAAVVLPGSDSQPKLRLPQVSGFACDGPHRHAHFQQTGFGTTGRVSGNLAHRFTLVGARPSGTS